MARGHIFLTYEIAMAAGKDAANRSMRAAGRTKWSAADATVAAQRVERLAVVAWRADHPEVAECDVPLDQALYELQLTQGYSCVTGRPRGV